MLDSYYYSYIKSLPTCAYPYVGGFTFVHLHRDRYLSEADENGIWPWA